MNRIDRLTAILIHLQSKKIVKAEEIAGRFEISKRTVYRDLKALEEAGVPIGAEAGKGYYLCEGYYLPPIMFTKNEAVSMLLAGKLVEKLTDQSTTNDYHSALYKIKSILDNTDKDFLVKLSDLVDIKVIPSFSENEGNTSFLPEIQKAIVEEKIICVDYFSSSKNELTKNRCIKPIGLCYYSNTWHLIAYCDLRNDYRDFRVDRIKQLHITQNSFERNELSSMDTYFDNLMQSNSDVIEMKVQFNKELYTGLHSQKYYFGFIKERMEKDFVEMTFINNSISYVGNWLLSFGNKAKVISPNTLESYMKSKAEEIFKHYYS